MQQRYIRNIPAISKEDLEILHSKKIAIVGCGGLGGHLIEMLARIGCREMVLIDKDAFEPTNLNRQVLADLSTIGHPKAKVGAKRIGDINEDIVVKYHIIELDDTNAATLIENCDMVLDGLDNGESRKVLKRACGRLGVPYVYGAVSGWVSQVALSMPEDDLIDLLYPEDSIAKDGGILSFTTAFCASVQLAVCVKHLIGKNVKSNTIFYFDLLNQEYEEIPIT